MQMLLNEDYFDDLKLTDDDIQTSDNTNTALSGNDYYSPEQMYAEMQSKYSTCICVEHFFRTQDFNEPPGIHGIPQLIKRLQYMFDAYGIDYSEPVLMCSIDETQDNLLFKFRSCKVFDYHGYKLITQYDSIEECKRGLYYEINVIMFLNLPDIRSYVSECKFVGKIVKIIWNNNSDSTESEEYCFNVWNLQQIKSSNQKYWGVFLPNPDSLKRTNLLVSTERVKMIFKIFHLFFPEKTLAIVRKEFLEQPNTNVLTMLPALFGYIYPDIKQYNMTWDMDAVKKYLSHSV